MTEAHDNGVSLRLRRGDRLVITGPSGVGKTTLLHTLLEWRPAREGTIQRSDDPVGYVSVESSLLSGSLRENLTLGASISDDELFGRLRTLGLSGERFNDLDAELLRDGRGMSSGERVRLVLARALLNGSVVLVLDDVAGVLDADARNDVRLALDQLDDIAIIEATVDTPLITSPTLRIELDA